MGTWKTIARQGYEAYAQSTGGLTYDGRPMPTWEELPERIRDAWVAAAKSAVHTAYSISLHHLGA